jgi:putative Mg2+ transporter-C (MgtC) family protein
MPTYPTWPDIALRLLLTVMGGALIGLNRSEHGRPVGLRTTMLVCLAASVAMIEANLLMSEHGKTPDSFVVLDLMRLPLGILDGMGFIGAGAILRKGNFVIGVTTAATLWFVTVMGLCFGGGQLALGLAALGLGLGILWCLKWAESYLHREHRAMLAITVATGGPDERELHAALETAGFHVARWTSLHLHSTQPRQLECEVIWRQRPADRPAADEGPTTLLNQLAAREDVMELDWTETTQMG